MTDELQRDWRLGEMRLGRRALMRGSLIGGAGLAAAALIGCGSDEDEPEEAGAATSESTQGATAAGVGELIKDDDLPYPYQFPEPDKPVKPGGVMVVGVNSDVSTMDPTRTTASGTGRVVNMVYNRLMGFNRGVRLHPFELDFEPELAKSWERSPDGLVVTFQIHEGIKWQNLPPLNGRAFVAEDARYAFERYKAGGVNISYWLGADSIEAPDDHTLKVTLKKPYADFLTPLASAYQTIFPRELVDSGEIEGKVIGTGPMILTESAAGSGVKFDRNPDYWEYPVHLDGVEFRLQVDTPARLASFRAEQTDVADILVTTIADAQALVDTNRDVQINHGAGVTGQPFAMNLQNPKFSDVRVRRALSLGINRDSIMDLVYPGLGKVLALFPWIFLFDSQPTVEEMGDWTRYAPEEAVQLLSAAGLDSLELSNTYYPYSQAYEQLGDVLTDQFRQINVTLTGGKAEYTEFNSKWTTRQLPEVSTGGWPTIGFDADNYFYNCLHSESGGNRWNLSDPQIDEWATQQQTELDPEARKEIMRQIWDHDLDQAYHPVVGTGTGFYVYQPWLRGIRFGGAMGSSNNYQDIGDMMGDAWLDK